ncbi:DUF1697 domain-containing protein [Thalassovita sp.]|uniref:DUF1697 domain-containing protein n=1 Tax=Thalassovita sp. TaxID=1979401 RepID=UPI002B273CA4|nr:DUF1697 domain-containing protein [Thalassovita sp.]
MTRWAIFLRGVNVGGHGKLPMADLRRSLRAIGAVNVATNIQSGNIVMDHDEDSASAISEMVSGLIEKDFGFRPTAVAIPPEALDTLISALKPPDTIEPKNIHVYLLDGDPPPDLPTKMSPYCTQGEEVLLLPNAIAVFTPNGIGRSKLAAPLDRFLKNRATARNLNSLRKVQAMLGGKPK